MSTFRHKLPRKRIKPNPDQRCEDCDWVEPGMNQYKMNTKTKTLDPAVLCGCYRKPKFLCDGKYCKSFIKAKRHKEWKLGN